MHEAQERGVETDPFFSGLPPVVFGGLRQLKPVRTCSYRLLAFQHNVKEQTVTSFAMVALFHRGVNQRCAKTEKFTLKDDF
jgi:hypothetical protein